MKITPIQEKLAIYKATFRMVDAKWTCQELRAYARIYRVSCGRNKQDTIQNMIIAGKIKLVVELA